VVSRALCTISYRAFLYTALPFPRCFVTDIVLLPLYRPLPCCGVCSRRAANAVLNSDGSDSSNSRAAISRRLNKE